MRGALAIAVVLALAVLAAVFLHGLDLAPEVRPPKDPLPLVDEVIGWRHRHLDPATGRVIWQAEGDRARPEGTAAARIERVRLVFWGDDAARPLTATADLATATWAGKEAVVRFERDIDVAQGGWRFRTDDLYLTIPPKAGAKGPDEERARLETDRPITLSIDDPRAVFHGRSGLRASAEKREARLLPPIEAEVAAEALAKIDAARPSSSAPRKDETLFLRTEHPVRVVEVGEDAYDVILTGPTRGEYRRPDETEPFEGLLRGGRIRLRKPEGAAPSPPPAKPREGAFDVGAAPASAEFGGGVEVRKGGVPVVLGASLRWDRATETATIEGAPGAPAELRRLDADMEVLAPAIRYLVAESAAVFSGGVRGKFPYDVARRAPQRDAPPAPAAAPAPWTIEAASARVEFERIEGRLDPVRVRLDGADGAPARLVREASTLAARTLTYDRLAGEAKAAGDVRASLERSLWGGREAAARAVTRTAEGGGEAPAGATEPAYLAASDWDIEADRATVRFLPGSTTVTAVELAGTGRQAALRSRPRPLADAPGAKAAELPPAYEVIGARIRADRDTGVVEVTPGEGPSRQMLVRGRDRLEAREIRYDERAGVALAAGEVIFVRAAEGDEPALRAEAATVELRFQEGRRPEAIVARGSKEAPVRVFRLDEERPLRLTAPRIEGRFDPATRRLAKVFVEGEGGPVLVEPAYAAPPDERFRIEGGRVEVDLATGEGEVFGLGGAQPLALRGAKERLTAKRVTFDVRERVLRLTGGVAGRFLASAPDPLRPREEGAERAPTLFDLEADEATASLATGIPEVEARGKVRFRDEESEIVADRAVYDRGVSTVKLEGRPLEVRRGATHETSSRTLTIRLRPAADKKEVP